ncbi:MAG: YybH family protein [Paludibacter sp.]
MHKPILITLATLLLFSCANKIDIAKEKADILKTEQAFEKLAADSGIAYAFNAFAADSAVILRGNDSIIHSKQGIFNYYSHNGSDSASVTWTADFVDVSDDATMGYTYGKYLLKVLKANKTTKEYKGTFHTVWKKQPDGSWKYVWD